MRGPRRPRVLVTGFSRFPGTPENPTEALIGVLERRGVGRAADADIHLATLPVEYLALPARLEALGESAAPDIAIHFGVSSKAQGFAIEMLARNRMCTVRPDNAGHVPAIGAIVPGGGPLGSSLPVAAVLAGLAVRGLPVALSDDAGDYLCNFLFYLSRGAHHPPFAPMMAGFVHVPPFGAPVSGEGDRRFDLAMLVEGTEVVVAACCGAWGRLEPSEVGSRLPP